jgi:DNA recombination protein RmuC
MTLDAMVIVLALVAGLLLGLAVAFVFRLVQAKTARELAEDLFREHEAQRKADIDAVIENVLKLAKDKLESERQININELNAKKSLIDQQLQSMAGGLEKVSNLMRDLEMDRVEKFGQLATQLQATNAQTAALMQTTSTLREALASTKKRGDWGERMAEDVLRLAGFIENVNYLKQKAIEGVGTRPDFTFLLPKSLKLHMDVKFPLENYIRFLEATADGEKARFRNDFLRDVRARIKEITTREYIDPESNTVDYVLLFIPNEQVYAFIHEQDSAILDEALRNKVVICSPITLFAVLAVIRQAVDNFALERTSNEILSLLGAFKKQWDEFAGKFDLLGRKIGDVVKEYEALTTTRKRQLEKPLNKIEDLRSQRGLPVAFEDEKPTSPTGGSEG